MVHHDGAGDREPEAASASVPTHARRIDPMEPLENRRQFTSRNPLAGVADAHATLAIDHRREDIDSATRRSVAQRIVEEVREHLLEANAIAEDPARHRSCFEREGYPLRLVLRERRCDCSLGNSGSIDASEDEPECMLLGRRDLAQVRREPPQSIDLAPHRRHEAAS